MKNQNPQFTFVLWFLFAFVLTLYSCSSVSLTKRQYNRGYHVEWPALKKTRNQVSEPQKASQRIANREEASPKDIAAGEGNTLTSKEAALNDQEATDVSTDLPNPQSTSKKPFRALKSAEPSTNHSEEFESITPAEKPLSALFQHADNNDFSLSFSQKFMLNNYAKKAAKSHNKGSSKSVEFLLLVIISIILPPLGMFLHDGGLTTRFLISLLLTIFFFLPGLIYTLYYVITEN